MIDPKIKNPVLIVLTGGLLAAAPATTATLFFLFTADGYMIAMFLAALAVYMTRINEKRICCNIIGATCICISCGIYQAYVSFALVLSVCYFINELLHNTYSKKEGIKWVYKQVIIYISALTSYYIIWKLALHFSGAAADTYQGISEVGTVSFSLILHGAINAVKATFLYFLQWNVLEHGFSLYSILSIIFFVVFIIGLAGAFIKSRIFERKWEMIFFILCLISIIPFSCMWCFVSGSVAYHALMLQSFTLLFILTGLLYEEWFGALSKNIVCVLLILIIFNNSLMANISYFYMNLCYERTYADGLEMTLKIHELQKEYEFDKIAVLGNRITDVQWLNNDLDGSVPVGKIHVLSALLDTNLINNSGHLIPFLKTTFGLELQPVNEAEIKQLSNYSDITQEMSCWPEENSMKIIDNVLIIKLAEEQETE